MVTEHEPCESPFSSGTSGSARLGEFVRRVARVQCLVQEPGVYEPKLT